MQTHAILLSNFFWHISYVVKTKYNCSKWMEIQWNEVRNLHYSRRLQNKILISPLSTIFMYSAPIRTQQCCYHELKARWQGLQTQEQGLVIPAQGQGLVNWSSRVLEDKDFPREQQYWYTVSRATWYYIREAQNSVTVMYPMTSGCWERRHRSQ